MKAENIIGDIKLKNTDPSKLVYLSAFALNSNYDKPLYVTYTQEYFTSLVNKSYKWLNKQVDKKVYDNEIDNILIEPVKDKII